jgi:hypothetical protein
LGEQNSPPADSGRKTPRRSGPTESASFSHDHGRGGALCRVSRLPRSLRTTFPVQQMLSTPVLVGVVARAAGKGVGTAACRVCVAGDRADRRRKLMRSRLGGTGCHRPLLLLLSTSCRYLRLASSRLNGLRDNKSPPESFPVDAPHPSQTPAGCQARELTHQKCPRNDLVASPVDVLEGLTLPSGLPRPGGGARWVFRWQSEKR